MIVIVPMRIPCGTKTILVAATMRSSRRRPDYGFLSSDRRPHRSVVQGHRVGQRTDNIHLDAEVVGVGPVQLSTIRSESGSAAKVSSPQRRAAASGGRPSRRPCLGSVEDEIVVAAVCFEDTRQLRRVDERSVSGYDVFGSKVAIQSSTRSAPSTEPINTGVARDLLHGGQEGPGPPLGGTGVDDKDPGVRDDGPGVVQPPRAVWLDPGMDAVGHQLQTWFAFIAHRCGSAPRSGCSDYRLSVGGNRLRRARRKWGTPVRGSSLHWSNERFPIRPRQTVP